MSAFKQFLSQDLIVTPFEVNKGFYFSGSNELDADNVEINRLIGQNLTGSFNPESDPITGTTNAEYSRLVFASIQHLYYSNYISSSSGSLVSVPYTYLGSDPSGDVVMGDVSSAGRFDNYLGSTISYTRFFPTGAMDKIGVVSIPSKLYGTQLAPNSVMLKSGSFQLTDDGNGNLVYNNEIYGNVLYPHGLIVITNFSGSAIVSGSVYGGSVYGTAKYGGSVDLVNLEDFILGSELIVGFSSSVTLFETQFKCQVNFNEFNFSLNPTLVYTGSQVYDFATGSYFSPYVTTVGLYNEKQELMAVAKMSQPVPLNTVTNTNILVNIDK